MAYKCNCTLHSQLLPAIKHVFQNGESYMKGESLKTAFEQ